MLGISLKMRRCSLRIKQFQGKSIAPSTTAIILILEILFVYLSLTNAALLIANKIFADFELNFIKSHVCFRNGHRMG
jgi:hypothetical protein